MGIVEVDETFIGGKRSNRHKDKRSGGAIGGADGKAIVVGAVSRKGNVVARVIDNAGRDTSAASCAKTVSTEG